MRVLLLRPPRYLWPFNSAASAFWPPLGLLCIAAAVRRALPEVRVDVWDAPGQRCGWRTLEAKLAAEPIDVLGIGEETVSAHEAIRAAALVRRLHPRCVIVAGGTYFSHAIEPTLSRAPIDVIVRGEGERTFTALLRDIDHRPRWRSINGLAFRDGDGEIIATPARGLIDDLDTLPRPAYDLIDVSAYGRRARNHRDLVSIEHSRGCIDSCAFCILWKHMGERCHGNGQVRPRYRTKSPQGCLDEVLWLYHDFGRRTFGWVDPTFNAAPAWSDAWAELMLKSALMDARGRPRTLHTAWLRADCVVRDEKLGILKKLVRAGLRQAIIGLERDDDAGLAALGKHRNDARTCREAVAIFREKYPAVYTIGSLIFGLPNDTWEDFRRLMKWQDELGVDYCFLIPLTPNPGTSFPPDRTDADFRHHNFHTPVRATGTLDRRALEGMYWRMMLRPSPRRLAWAVRQFLVQRDARKRCVSLSLFKRGTEVAVRSLCHTLLGSHRAEPVSYSRKPPWYDT